MLTTAATLPYTSSEVYVSVTSRSVMNGTITVVVVNTRLTAGTGKENKKTSMYQQ